MDDIQIIEKISRHEQEIKNTQDTLARHESILTKLENEAGAIDRLSFILEEERKTSQKTVETLNVMSTTLSTMNVSLNNQIQEVRRELVINQEDFKSALQEVNEKIGQTDIKVNTLSEKGKFDFMTFIKDKAIPVLIGGGVAYFIISTIPK